MSLQEGRCAYRRCGAIAVGPPAGIAVGWGLDLCVNHLAHMERLKNDLSANLDSVIEPERLAEAERRAKGLRPRYLLANH